MSDPSVYSSTEAPLCQSRKLDNAGIIIVPQAMDGVCVSLQLSAESLWSTGAAQYHTNEEAQAKHPQERKTSNEISWTSQVMLRDGNGIDACFSWETVTSRVSLLEGFRRDLKPVSDPQSECTELNMSSNISNRILPKSFICFHRVPSVASFDSVSEKKKYI